MPLTVTCPCGNSFAVREEFAGKKGKCPACGQILVAPAAPSSLTAEVVAAARSRWPDQRLDLCAVKVPGEVQGAAVQEALVAEAHDPLAPSSTQFVVLRGTGREGGVPCSLVGALGPHANRALVPWFCRCAPALQPGHDHSLLLALNHDVDDMLRADGGAMQIAIAQYQWIDKAVEAAGGGTNRIKALLDSEARLPGAPSSSAGMTLEPLRTPLGGYAAATGHESPVRAKARDAEQHARAAEEQAVIRQLSLVHSAAEAEPALGSDNPNIRSAAIERLGSFRDTAARDLLITALKDEQALLRRKALELLGDLGDPLTIDALAERLDDEHEDPRVREEAVWALAKIHHPRAAHRAAATLARWAGENSYRTAPAVQALAAMKEPQIAELLVRQLPEDAAPESGTLRALRSIGSPYILPALFKALATPDYGSRLLIVQLLGESKDSRAVDPLMALMKEEDKHLRRAAIEALGTIGDIRAAPAFQEAAHDKSKSVRKAAFDALQQMGITWI